MKARLTEVNGKSRYVVYCVRKNADLTQAEFGKKFGISQTTLSAIESGKRLPSRDLLQKIGAWCGLSEAQMNGEKPFSKYALTI